MRTAFWLYLFMFIAIFDLHAQYPVLSPFALSIGAVPSFIGLIMGLYSATHIPGNILAGYGIDRYGSKVFIVFSLIIAGLLLLLQAHVTEPWELLAIRSVSGFILAFLSPACLALLAKVARDQWQQSRLMSGNGLVHTLASVVSPAAGALLVAKLGFSLMFVLLGWVLILTGIIAIFFIRDEDAAPPEMAKPDPVRPGTAVLAHPEGMAVDRIPWLFYLLPLAISCSQGVLFFELPLSETARASIMTSGLLFSVVSLGSLLTLSMLFLARHSAFLRTAAGGLLLAFSFFGLAMEWPRSLNVLLFIIGMAKGIVYPALATMLAQMTGRSRYGRIFAVLSIAYSVGAFLGPVMAGKLRDLVSPYFLSFLFLMLAIALLPCSRPPLATQKEAGKNYRSNPI